MIAMNSEAQFKCNKVLKLDNTMLIYGINNAYTLAKLIKYSLKNYITYHNISYHIPPSVGIVYKVATIMFKCHNNV